MKVLVACEESQRVCIEFRKKGHRAFSCDIQECSGGRPEWHIMGDVLPLLNGNCTFTTMYGKKHEINGNWDLIIAHPPCTYLSNACTRGFSLKRNTPEYVIDRWEKRAKAAVFFMQFVAANAKYKCIENPVGFMTNAYRKPDQYIDPYMFCDSVDSDEYVTKKTGLWLFNLPKLERTNDFKKPTYEKYFSTYSGGFKSKDWCTYISATDRASARSKTFVCIARAMADQWGGKV